MLLLQNYLDIFAKTADSENIRIKMIGSREGLSEGLLKKIDNNTSGKYILMNDIDFVDMENDNGNTLIYGNPNDLYKIKEAILSIKNDIEFTVDTGNTFEETYAGTVE